MGMVPVAACTTSISDAVWIHRACTEVTSKRWVLLARIFQSVVTRTENHSDAKTTLYTVKYSVLAVTRGMLTAITTY
jgi:hypothetical protein